MSEAQARIAPLGPREKVIVVTATLSVTQGADTTTTLAVTFDDPFVVAPQVHGVVCTDAAAVKANFAATDITTTGMNVRAYQVLAADLVTGDYDVDVTISGWRAA